MLSAVFKGLYRNHGIYWHGKHGYGDETNAWCTTIGEYRARIDAKIADEAAAREAAMQPHDHYWASLSADERRKWRIREAQAHSDMSVSEFAYANRHESR